jgi:hypothetical protein
MSSSVMQRPLVQGSLCCLAFSVAQVYGVDLHILECRLFACEGAF